MFCPNCGEKLPEGSAFCGKCGTRLPKMHVSDDAGREDTAAAPGGPTHENASGEPVQNHRTRRQDETGASSADSGSPDGGKQSGKGGGGKKAVLAAVIAAVAVIILAAAAFLSIFGGIPGGVSGGAEDDGVITVTFDCGTEETADSGAGGSNEEDAAADSEANASSGDSTDSATADVVGTSSVNYAPETQDVTESGLAQCPAYPTREGYVFGGWYTDEDYTEEFDFSTEVTEDLTLYARWLDPEDEEAQITQEDLEEFSGCLDAFNDLYAEYANENGYVVGDDVETVLEMAEELAAEYQQAGVVTCYIAEEDSVYLEFSSLLTYVFSCPGEGTDSDQLSVSSSMVFPYYGMRWAYVGESAEVDAREDAIVGTVNAFSDLSEIRYGDDFTWENGLDFMENSDVVVWHGHGGYSIALGSRLGTSLIYSDSTSAQELQQTFIGGTDITLGEALTTKMVTHGSVGGIELFGKNVGDKAIYILTPAFFEAFLPELDGAIVYLAACGTGFDDRLADAFLEKGAEVVIAINGSESIDTEYNQNMVNYIFTLMSGQDAADVGYCTVKEALDILGERGYSVSFSEDAQGNLTYQDAYPDLYYADEDAVNYTLWAGIEGMLSIDSALELDPAELTVSVVNDVTGATVDVVTPDEDGSFSIDRMNGGEEYTYTLYVQKGDAVLLTMEEMELQAHRILDLGTLSVEAAQLTVYVRNEDGEILEGVSAQVTGSDGTAYEMTAGTDGAGSVIYQAKVLPGEYTLSLSADGYEGRTETVMVTAAEITLLEYTLEEFDRTAMYQAYYDKLMELQEEYGEATLDEYEYESNCYSYSLSGVFLAQLVDFDADGSEELLLVYREYPGHIELTQMDCHIEVWRYEGNNIVKCFDGSGISGNGNVTAIYLLNVDGVYYLLEGESDGFVKNSIVGLRDGNFTEAVNLYEKDNDPYPDFYINGVLVSQDEYKKEYSRWFDNSVYYLESFYSEEDYDHDPRPVLEETLAVLREYLSAAEDRQDSEDEPG